MGGEKRVWRSATPHAKVAGPRVPKKIGTSCVPAHSMRNNSQIRHGDQTGCEDYFYMVDHAPLSWPKCLVTRMLTRDLFAVANLVWVDRHELRGHPAT